MFRKRNLQEMIDTLKKENNGQIVHWHTIEEKQAQLAKSAGPCSS